MTKNDVVDISNKEEFIEKLKSIKNNNLGGKIEVIKLDLSGLSKLIVGHLDFINLNKPIMIDKSKLRRITREYNKEKHQHGLTLNNIYDALKSINDPYIIIQNQNNPYNITFYTNVLTERGDNVFVGLDFNYKYKKQQVVINHIETIFGSNVINRDVYEKIGKLNGRKVVYKKRSGWFATIAPTTTSINII